MNCEEWPRRLALWATNINDFPMVPELKPLC
jgi:hypothetical protein